MRECTPTREEARALAKDHALIPVYREVLADMLTPVRAYTLLCPPGDARVPARERRGRRAAGPLLVHRLRAEALDLGRRRSSAALRAVAAEVDRAGRGHPAIPRRRGRLPRLRDRPPLRAAARRRGRAAADARERVPARRGPGRLRPRDAAAEAADHPPAGPRGLRRGGRPHRRDGEPPRVGPGAVLRPRASTARPGSRTCHAGPVPRDGRRGSGAHPRRRRVPDRRLAAFQQAARGEPVRRLSLPARDQPVAVHVLPRRWAAIVTSSGTSPEKLVQVEGRRVETRPLAGTRRRGADPAEDARLEKELLSDLKERAEHVMLVDLGRNDVGRVARPGTVSVDRLMEVERYSHVMHISSTVSGELRDGCTSLDALRAAFPAGTVSGAPKIRAMEVIAELEPDQRGVYAGSLGYVSFGGNLDMAITLRTVVVAGRRSRTCRPAPAWWPTRGPSGSSRRRWRRRARCSRPSRWRRRCDDPTPSSPSSTTTTRSPTTWSSTSASSAPSPWSFATTR